MTCPSWVALHGIAHSFIELHKPLHHNKAVIHEGEDYVFFALKGPAAAEPALKMISPWEQKAEETHISEVLDLCEVDAETILCNLGFMQEEMEAASWIPARFFAVPSQAQGIDFQLLLRSQVQRIEMEDPCLMLASRFRQVQTLAAMADAFFCLYSYVSKTPVQKISPVHFFWALSEIPDSWNIPCEPQASSPFQRLRRAVSRMCLYTSPREGESPLTSNVQAPRSRLEQIVSEVMNKARKDRLCFDMEEEEEEEEEKDEGAAPTGPTGDPFCQSRIGSVFSKSTAVEVTPLASCFCWDAASHSRGNTSPILPWLPPCSGEASLEGPDHYGQCSPPVASSLDDSSEEELCGDWLKGDT
ncbi:Protein TESPA1 [Varanus komodoensis]|nr:Protein TESPA1 [Varanus komodoensis]